MCTMIKYLSCIKFRSIEILTLNSINLRARHEEEKRGAVSERKRKIVISRVMYGNYITRVFTVPKT